MLCPSVITMCHVVANQPPPPEKQMQLYDPDTFYYIHSFCEPDNTNRGELSLECSINSFMALCCTVSTCLFSLTWKICLDIKSLFWVRVHGSQKYAYFVSTIWSIFCNEILIHVKTNSKFKGKSTFFCVLVTGAFLLEESGMPLLSQWESLPLFWFIILRYLAYEVFWWSEWV